MLLVGRNGDCFGLNIAGYQFPHIDRGEWDANWLNISIDVRTALGRWATTDPSLLTRDIQELAEWLDDATEDRSGVDDIHFLEPNLSFGVRDTAGEMLTLRVWFELESRPPWATHSVAGQRDVWVDLDVTKDEIRGAADDLRDQLRRFPPRPDEP